MKLKITIFTLVFVFLFYFSILVAGFIPFIAEYKTEFSPDVIMDYALDILFHPIMNIKEMHAAANPMLYVSLGAAVFLFIYLLYKSRSKNYENVGEKYGVQGSSRWAKNKEVFKVPEQITVIPSKDMFAALKNTMKNDEVK